MPDTSQLSSKLKLNIPQSPYGVLSVDQYAQLQDIYNAIRILQRAVDAIAVAAGVDLSEISG